MIRESLRSEDGQIRALGRWEADEQRALIVGTPKDARPPPSPCRSRPPAGWPSPRLARGERAARVVRAPRPRAAAATPAYPTNPGPASKPGCTMGWLLRGSTTSRSRGEIASAADITTGEHPAIDCPLCGQVVRVHRHGNRFSFTCFGGHTDEEVAEALTPGVMLALRAVTENGAGPSAQHEGAPAVGCGRRAAAVLLRNLLGVA